VYRYCSPTRSSFLSGRLPYHDHQTNGGLFGSHFGTNLNLTLLPTKLQRAGYRTAMRGKWHCGFSRPEYMPSARGFEDYAGNLMGGCDHVTQQSSGAIDSWRSNSAYDGPDRRNGTGYETYRLAADMCSIIRAEDARPLFLFASLLVVHEPLQAPPELVAQYERAHPDWCPRKHTLAAMSSTADNATAQIVAALKEQGMWTNTVLVFASDSESLPLSCHPCRTSVCDNRVFVFSYVRCGFDSTAALTLCGAHTQTAATPSPLATTLCEGESAASSRVASGLQPSWHRRCSHPTAGVGA
jgi:arylsulfatase B